MSHQTLSSKRLIIRRFQSQDWKDVYDYLSKEDVVAFEPYGVQSESECQKIALQRSEDDSFWAVWLKSNQKVIGNLYFNQLMPTEFRAWELGYVFNSDFHHQGFATESCKTLLDYAFDALSVRRVVAHCNPENTASWKLLERLKFRREGHFMKAAFFNKDNKGNPLWHDAFQYAILKEEWHGSV